MYNKHDYLHSHYQILYLDINFEVVLMYDMLNHLD